jgi:hypothetical protein
METSWVLSCTKALLLGLFLFPFSALMAQTGNESAGPKSCPPPRALTAAELLLRKADLDQDQFVSRKATALVGVDALGRAAVGIDTDQNGTADQLLLFTAQERLGKTWARTFGDASVHIRKGSLLLTSKAESFALVLAAKDASVPAVPKWATDSVVHTAGRELSRLFAEGGQSTVQLSDLRHNDVGTWPSTFHYDLLDPGTGGQCQFGQCCDPSECIAGGMPATNCSIGNCAASPFSCSVGGCTPHTTCPGNFACCLCTETGAPSCRCKGCTQGNCQ